MTDFSDLHRFYWERYTEQGKTAGDLAALRRGLSGEPGTVPTMWPLYRRQQNEPSEASFRAEHHALTLFAIHQRPGSVSVHQPKVHMASCLRKLHGRFEQQAVDRRFFSAVTSDDVRGVAHHLRGLVRQLHALKAPTAFDYNELQEDLRNWEWPDARSRVRRRWGLDYHRLARDDDEDGVDPL